MQNKFSNIYIIIQIIYIYFKYTFIVKHRTNVKIAILKIIFRKINLIIIQNKYLNNLNNIFKQI